MSVIATSNQRLSNLVKREYQPEMAYCRKKVAFDGTGAIYGNFVGKVTATGKYKISVENATDGSQNVEGVVVGIYSFEAGVDDNVLIIIDKGPCTISKAGLVFHSSYDTDAKKAAVYAALEAKGIQVLDAT